MKQITVATYNIRHGHDVGCDWKRIAEVVARSGADIVGFQEIDMYTNRIAGRDTVAGLSDALDLENAVFIPAMNFDGGQYGTAILSRFHITAFEMHALDAGNYEPRAFGCVRISPDHGQDLCFLNTHLSYESHTQQKSQISQLADFMDKHIPKGMPTILVGDFNTEDFSVFAPLNAMGYDLINHEKTNYKTFRTEPLAIDHIVYSRSQLSPVKHGMIDSNASDHNLLFCTFEMI